MVAMELDDFIKHYMDVFRVITLDAQVRYSELKAFCVYSKKQSPGSDQHDDLGNVSDPEI